MTTSRLSLTQIADEEGTDKGTRGPLDSWPGHGYTDVYSAYFEPVRDQAVTLLEIGLGVTGDRWPVAIAQGRNQQGGASLRMWKRYFSRARLLGIDLNPARFLDDDRTTTGVADQSRPHELVAFLEAVGVDQLDFVIDDGSHRADHQQISLAALFPFVRPGGTYFIEDLDDQPGPASGSSGPVRATRDLLDGFVRTGRFEGAHAVADPDALASMIAGVSFHVPPIGPVTFPGSWAVRAGTASRVLLGRPVPGRPTYQLGHEKLCAIRKKESAEDV